MDEAHVERGVGGEPTLHDVLVLGVGMTLSRRDGGGIKGLAARAVGSVLADAWFVTGKLPAGEAASSWHVFEGAR